MAGTYAGPLRIAGGNGGTAGRKACSVRPRHLAYSLGGTDATRRSRGFTRTRMGAGLPLALPGAGRKRVPGPCSRLGRREDGAADGAVPGVAIVAPFRQPRFRSFGRRIERDGHWYGL
jgi:hypothetical protein